MINNLINRLFLMVLASGFIVINENANAQVYREPSNSQNPCGYIIDGMNPMGSDFYERMNAYQICAEQNIGQPRSRGNSGTTTASPAMCRQWKQAYTNCLNQRSRATTPAGMAMNCEQWQQLLQNGRCT